MRRLFCILFVLLFSMLSMATKKAPLYIIDGSFETQNQNDSSVRLCYDSINLGRLRCLWLYMTACDRKAVR